MALRASFKVRLNLPELLLRQVVIEIRREHLDRRMFRQRLAYALHDDFSKAKRKFSRPRAIRERTVPTGNRSTAAISS